MPASEAGFNVERFCGDCHIADIATFMAKCEQLRRLLEHANREVNLTRIDDVPAFWERHIADSIAIGIFFPELTCAPLTLADVGCGAGFPAVPLALAFPQLQICAIDSIGKKIRFVEMAAAELGLRNLRAVTARSRELPHKTEWLSKFDVLTARAVADARTLFRENRQLVKPNGKFIFYKTPEQAAAELPEVTKASSQYRLEWETSPEFCLPHGGGTRQFLFSVSSYTQHG